MPTGKAAWGIFVVVELYVLVLITSAVVPMDRMPLRLRQAACVFPERDSSPLTARSE
jgi:hypothetical protein